MTTVSINVNGKDVSADVEDRTLLVQLLRENLGLTGTHVGCDTSQCGACLVHMDGIAVKSCTILAAQANGSSVTPQLKDLPMVMNCILYRLHFVNIMDCSAGFAHQV